MNSNTLRYINELDRKIRDLELFLSYTDKYCGTSLPAAFIKLCEILHIERDGDISQFNMRNFDKELVNELRGVIQKYLEKLYTEFKAL